MIDFSRIESYNKELVESLIKIKNSEGFYGSTPLNSNTSFTTTGLVLQAFNEARATNEAQKLTDDLTKLLDRKYEDSQSIGFPNENGETPHVMCNAGIVFAILECRPSLVQTDVLGHICNWFIQTQHHSGYWNLYPDVKSESLPVWTSYAANTMIQFYDCCQRHGKPTQEIEKSIRQAVQFLQESRPDIAKEMNLLLWSQTDNPKEVRISFAMSAMCLHILLRYSDRFNDSSMRNLVMNTLKSVFDGFDKESQTFKFTDYKVDLWGAVHHHTRQTYVWSFFMPISLVTILKLLPEAHFGKNEKYYSFIKYGVDWILENNITQYEKMGVRGSQDYAGFAIWSTAQASTVLSRVIINAHKLKKLEDEVVVGARKTPMQIVEEGIESYMDELKGMVEKDANGIATKMTFLLSLIAAIVLTVVSWKYIIPNWTALEPYTWYIAIMSGLIPTALTFKSIDKIIKQKLTEYLLVRKVKVLSGLKERINK